MDAGGSALSTRPAPGAGQRTRRVWEEVGPTLSPRAGAPGERPRRGRGRRRAAAGPGLGAGDARRPREAQSVPGATAWGLGVGSYDGSARAPHSTKGAVASASLQAGTTQLGTWPKDNRFGGPAATVTIRTRPGAAEGPLVPDPDPRGHPSPAHFREAGFGEKSGAVLIKFSGLARHLCSPMAVREGLHRFSQRGIKKHFTQNDPVVFFK